MEEAKGLSAQSGLVDPKTALDLSQYQKKLSKKTSDAILKLSELGFAYVGKS